MKYKASAAPNPIDSELYLPFARNSVVFNQIVVTIDEPVKEPSYYRMVTHEISNLSEDDEVRIKFNSPGGNAWGMVSLLNAIKTTDAQVIGVIEGECHSAASILALHCQNVIVMPYGTMMVHACSYGTVGKDSDIVAHVSHATDWNKGLIESTYEGFLSPSEIKEVLSGREIWLNAEQMVERFEARAKFLEKKLKAEASVNTKPTSKRKSKAKTDVNTEVLTED